MKKTICFLLIVFLISCSHQQKETQLSGVKTLFVHSEAASFLHFIDTGFKQPRTSRSLRELIEKNKVTKFTENKNINSYLLLKSYLRKGYNFDSVSSRPRGVFGEDTMNMLAVTSKNMEEFEDNLSSILPYDGINAYFELKDEFYRSFKSIMWDPSLGRQERNLDNLEDIVQKTNFRDQLKLARKFYRSNYPRQLPLKVGLIPIPDAEINNKHTSALNLRDVQVVPYLSSKGAASSLDVIFHEFCHAFFEGQSLTIQKQMEDFYLNHKDGHALFVYRYINEALATAWGNGWYSEIKEGKLSEKPWYTVDYIDVLAKKYLPLIKSYTERGKLLDDAFMEETIEIAKAAFPFADREIRANTFALKVLSDTSSTLPMAELSRHLHQHFRVHWMRRSYPFTAQDIQELNQDSFYTTLVLSSKEKKSFQKIKKSLGLKKQNLSKDFLAIVPKGKNYFIWIHSKKRQKVLKALSEVKARDLFKAKSEIIDL
jgi:hypothetical protein